MDKHKLSRQPEAAENKVNGSPSLDRVRNRVPIDGVADELGLTEAEKQAKIIEDLNDQERQERVKQGISRANIFHHMPT